MSDQKTAQELFTGTKTVAESHRFDKAKLAAWMAENVEGYAGPLSVSQFKGGQSNPTYQLTTPNKKCGANRRASCCQVRMLLTGSFV